ncbi:hypothetical protein [Microbacterium maritypicum]
MRPLTEADVRASFVNADADELRLMEIPHDFLLVTGTTSISSPGRIRVRAVEVTW